ncbi:retinol binding protein receptor-domain-containing protein [Syncephalastrum racemosum]|uniref:Retinol binding protein receptor-domain-containing protein n=1 Tax=Syncephalastrum racemosum TaxID=13706 RepID=A0A1X2HA31_SYNRA|nr:retinol binding protein receptor-domain-containing protein [Syncephalastrum racemosum]
MLGISVFLFLVLKVYGVTADAFATQCWEALNGKQNLFTDGLCRQINQAPGGWQTYQTDDWVYYEQQYVNVSMTEHVLSFATVGGCCAPNRWKPTTSVYQDDGRTFADTGDKVVGIADAPLLQTISVETRYIRYFVDDHAVNLTLIPSVQFADKQALLYSLGYDRATIINYVFYDEFHQVLANQSTGVTRHAPQIADTTLPPRTRFIRISFYGSRANPVCFTYLYAGIYVDRAAATVTKVCSTLVSLFQYLALFNFILVPVIFGAMTVLFKSFHFPPQPSHPMLLCIFVMMGSFIFSQAWNLINSQESIFDEWLPRAVKIIELFVSFFLYAVYFYPVFLCFHASYRSRLANILGCYTTAVLFALRVVIDLPAFIITYARDVPFLVLSVAASVPAILAYSAVLLFFLIRAFTYQNCDLCRIENQEVRDIEERYVRHLFSMREFNYKRKLWQSWTRRIWSLMTKDIWRFSFKQAFTKAALKMGVYRVFGTHPLVRIPFIVKAALTLLIYCLIQLAMEFIGVGGIVPTHICAWSPYLSLLQYTPDKMAFAKKSMMLMQIATCFATVGGGIFCLIYSLGILRRVTKDIRRLRRGDYVLFKGKKENSIDLDDAIRFLGVCVGFGFTGTLYSMVEISLIGTAVAMLIQLDLLREAIIHHVGYVQLVQKRITSLIFIKSNSRFSIQNRAPLLHYWFFMMFTSMTRALTSYIIRTLKLLLRYPFFSLRVDRNAETWSVRRGDGGFVGYCGMLLAEHEYNNPVMLVFLECILHCLKERPHMGIIRQSSKSRCRRHLETNDTESHWDVTQGRSSSTLSQRARTRWFLAYTLIHNPMLRKCRKHVLDARKEQNK